MREREGESVREKQLRLNRSLEPVLSGKMSNEMSSKMSRRADFEVANRGRKKDL